MWVVFYAIGLVAGMSRRAGWLAIPVAAALPFGLWFTGQIDTLASFDQAAATGLAWAASAGAGCLISLMVQQYIVDNWTKRTSGQA